MSQHDVVVVGAGFAGLSAARALMNAGLDVVVLEAREVVGGRTDTYTDGVRQLELGGQWTGPGQNLVLELAASYGVETFETPHDGADVSLGEAMGALPLDDLQQAVAVLDNLAASVPPDAPWLAPEATRLDETRFADWLDSEVTNDDGRQALRHVIEGLMTASAEDMSLLTVLHAATTSGTLAAAMGIEGGAQELRLVDGLHGLALRMAGELGPRVRLASPVSSLRQDAAGVQVRAASGDFSAAAAIVAIPPSAWSQIGFEPELPPPHGALPAEMPMGSVIKLQMVFERPFWRDAGYSGLVMDHSAAFGFMVDNSTPTSSEGVLATFISATDVAKWSDRTLGETASELRRAALLAHITRAFDCEIPDPIAFVDRDWTAQRWIGGGYSGAMRPGGWTLAGAALREPVGRVHWASAESATMWTGYVDGAIQSGRRAAGEVIELLRG